MKILKQRKTSDNHNEAHNPEVLVHSQGLSQDQALHDREAGAVGEAEFLVFKLLKDLPSCLAIVVGHSDNLSQGTFQQPFPKLDCHAVAEIHTDEGQRFIKDVICGNKRQSILLEPVLGRLRVWIADIGQGVPAASINENPFHEPSTLLPPISAIDDLVMPLADVSFPSFATGHAHDLEDGIALNVLLARPHRSFDQLSHNGRNALAFACGAILQVLMLPFFPFYNSPLRYYTLHTISAPVSRGSPGGRNENATEISH